MLFSRSFTIDQLSVGQTDSIQKQLTENDVMQFAQASGDENPIHLDEEAGKASIFGQRVVHGILVSGLISSVIAGKLPGNGSVYLGQTLRFTKPTFINDTITATVTVTEIDTTRNRVTLKTICTNQHDETVITGEATVLPPYASEVA